MSVLLEALSMVVRVAAVSLKYDGGIEQFVKDIPNATACADGELVRVGFMNDVDASAFLELLKRRGLTHLDPTGATLDMVLVDAQNGLRSACDWLQFGSAEIQQAGSEQKAPIIWARMKGGQAAGLKLPTNWRPSTFQFVAFDGLKGRLRFIRTDGRVDVFEDLETGKEVYVGRTHNLGGT